MPLVCGLEGQEGCKVAANILHGLDCNSAQNDKIHLTVTDDVKMVGWLQILFKILDLKYAFIELLFDWCTYYKEWSKRWDWEDHLRLKFSEIFILNPNQTFLTVWMDHSVKSWNKYLAFPSLFLPWTSWSAATKAGLMTNHWLKHVALIKWSKTVKWVLCLVFWNGFVCLGYEEHHLSLLCMVFWSEYGVNFSSLLFLNNFLYNFWMFRYFSAKLFWKYLKKV